MAAKGITIIVGVQICRNSPICLKLLRQYSCCAWILLLLNAGKSKAARIAMTAMTTSNSIKVKARLASVATDGPSKQNLILSRCDPRLLFGSRVSVIKFPISGQDESSIDDNPYELHAKTRKYQRGTKCARERVVFSNFASLCNRKSSRFSILSISAKRDFLSPATEARFRLLWCDLS